MTGPTSAYGEHPFMPGEPRHDSAAQVPPPSVQNAVKLMFAGAALGVLGMVILWATKGTLQEQIQRSDPSMSFESVTAATNVALTVGSAVLLVVVVLYLLLALQVRKDKGWARIVTLVLSGLGVLTGLASLAQTEPALSRAVSLAALVVDIGILVLLFQARSRDYFRR